MRVKDLLGFLFDEQCVELVSNGLTRSTLFHGIVPDLPDEFKNLVVTSCYASCVDSGVLFVCVDEVMTCF